MPKETRTEGAGEALIQAIVELRRAILGSAVRGLRIISHTFGVDIDKNVLYRLLSKHYRPAPGGTEPSWLSFIGHTTDSLWSVDLFRCQSIVLRSLLGARGSWTSSHVLSSESACICSAVNGYPSDEHRFENDRQIGHASECESGGVSAEGAGTLGALAEPFLKSATFPGLIRQRGGRRYIWQSSRESWP